MTAHIHAINQLYREKCRDYNIPLYVSLVDYGKTLTPHKPKQYLHHCRNKEYNNYVYIVHRNHEIHVAYTDGSVTRGYIYKASDKMGIE